MSRFDPGSAEPSPGQQSKARLKWFNPTKGFGFVSPLDGAEDAFLHVSVLHRAGLQHLGDQAELLCEIGNGPKGPQVLNIIEVISPGLASPVQAPVEPAPAHIVSGPEQDAGGTVKWYKLDKGFGFVTIENSDKDVFVHKSVLQRSGLSLLEPGQRVRMRYQEVEKGREATWVALG